MDKSDIRHSHQTRFSANQNYSFPQVKSNIGKNSFNYMGPKLWAEIKMDVKNLPLKIFKNTITNNMVNIYNEES